MAAWCKASCQGGRGGYILSQYYKGDHIISHHITHLRWQNDTMPPVRVGEGGIYYHRTIRGIISCHITSPTSDGSDQKKVYPWSPSFWLSTFGELGLTGKESKSPHNSSKPTGRAFLSRRRDNNECGLWWSTCPNPYGDVVRNVGGY